MPVWHELTEPHRKAGRIAVLGILQEQHPDRALLFAQWKGIDWPLLVDSLNLLEVQGAPVTLFLDEAGTIRAVNPSRQSLESFLAEPAVEHEEAPPRLDAPALLARTTKDPLERASLDFLFGGTAGTERAIAAWESAPDPTDGRIHFRLGVAYRHRHDADAGPSGDFARAVHHWGRALETNPNQYIWRRRIQQYGPRMIKPYPFYDWVEEARSRITARGEVPRPLAIEPRGAELARPSRRFVVAEASEQPDAQGRVHRDDEGLVSIETTVVPARVDPGETVRVHLRLAPGRSAHWNNEADDMFLWIGAHVGWLPDRQLHRHEVPARAISAEPRHLEFEVRTPAQPPGNPLRGHALYYVCRDENGACLYRRQDFEIPIHFREETKR